MDTRLLIGILAVLAGAVILMLIPRSHTPAYAGPQTWTVLAGADEEDGVLQALRFLPEKLTIHVGDSVTWKLNAKDEHTVYFAAGGSPPELEMTGSDGRTYFNPVIFFASPNKTYDGTAAISGGMLATGEGQESTYILTFTKPGVYEYICAFHPGMKGTVTVVPANQKLPKTQTDYDQMALAETQKALMKAHEIHQAHLQPQATSRPNGSKEYTINLVGDMKTMATVLTFAPSPLHIKIGDTVTWKMSDPTELHTVTFPENPEELPEFVMVEPQDNGPPKLVVNPQVKEHVSGNTYDGSGYFNSGELFHPEGQPAPTYSLTFTKPGTYEYFCLVHTTAKMKGTIVVEAASQSQSQGSLNWTVLAGMEEEDGVLQALRFLPEKVAIHVGDSVTWKLNANAEEHTVYLTAGGPLPPFETTGSDGRNYFNPAVFFASQDKTYDGTSPLSGGVLSNQEGQQSAFTLTFTKPGVYEYVCAFHPGMKATVTVLPANQKLPKTQADYDQMAKAEAQQALMKAHELHQQMLQPAMTSRPDGSTAYTLDLMGDMQAEATALSFGPPSLQIKVGDTVTWKMSDFTELHTVTFLENPEELPEFVMPEPQDNGPPKLVVNPQVEKPAGGDTYAGSGYFNSGYLLRPQGQPAPTYSLTFTKPGTYQYVCLVHSAPGTQGIKGMKGMIVVAARETSAQPQQPAATTPSMATPAQGFTLHIDAKKHINEAPELVVHHYCKSLNEQLIQCLLFDSDAPNAHLIGEETIISPQIYAQMPDVEKLSWHYHKVEIPLVDAKLPGLSEEEAKKVVAAIEDTYGKVVIFWSPGTPAAPMGTPSVTKPASH